MMKNITLFSLLAMIVLVTSLLLPIKAYADVAQQSTDDTLKATVTGGEIKFTKADSGFFSEYINKVSGSIYEESTTWVPSLKKAAAALFACLMAISFTWTCVEIALRQGGVGEIFAELVKNAVFFGLFFFALKNADAISGVIFNTFTGLAAFGNTDGGPQAANVASLTMDLGFNYVELTAEEIKLLCQKMGIAVVVEAVKSLPFFLLMLGLGIFIFFVCALVCVKLLVAEAALWLLMYGGIFILGFGGSKWTKDIAISYFKTVIAVAFSYFGMLVLAQILVHQLSDVIQASWARFNAAYTQTAVAPGFFDMLPDAAVVLILYFLMNKVPELFSSMINGMHFTAGPASFAAAGAAMAAGAARVMTPLKVANKAFEKMGLHKPKESNTDKSLREISTEIKDLNKKFGSDANAGNASNGIKNISKNREGESAKNASEAKTESQEKSEPPAATKMKQDDAGSEAKFQAKAQSETQTKKASSQSNQSDVIDLKKEDYTVTKSAADGQKPAGSSEGSASSEQASSQPQTGYFEQLEKEIASNAEKKAQESSSQNDSRQTFTAQDANRYKSFYDAKKDFPQLERSEWSKATKDSYKNFTAKDASRYEDIYAARKDYPHLDLVAWQNARIKSTLDKAADAAKKKDN